MGKPITLTQKERLEKILKDLRQETFYSSTDKIVTLKKWKRNTKKILTRYRAEKVKNGTVYYKIAMELFDKEIAYYEDITKCKPMWGENYENKSN